MKQYVQVEDPQNAYYRRTDASTFVVVDANPRLGTEEKEEREEGGKKEKKKLEAESCSAELIGYQGGRASR